MKAMVKGLFGCAILILGALISNGAWAQTNAAPASPAWLKPVPINVAEAIIEPFWTPDLSGLRRWRIEAGAAQGAVLRQSWNAVLFEWASRPASGPALRMVRDFHVDCAGYDRLVVSLALPKGSVLRVTAQTDTGERVFVSAPASEPGDECALNLDGATRLITLTLEMMPGESNSAVGWLRWIGLQNTPLLPQYFAQWDRSNTQWDLYLKGPDQPLRFEPRYGIFLNTNELADLRSQPQQGANADGESRYVRLVKSSRDFIPEKGIHEFAKSGGDVAEHGRTRDRLQPSLPGGPELAEAGLVLRDAGALRMAARYALCLAMSEHWEMGFMSRFPGGPWEDRCFRRSYSCQDIAQILDLAGEVFTDAGRTYLLRRLAEEGVGPINYAAWRHEYIFHCNQLAYFNHGRMCAYLVLEREWPRVKPYTDLAYRDTIDNLETAIEPDGGCLEGPGYLSPTVRENYYVLQMYARSRGKSLPDLIPAVLTRTSDYAAVVASTTTDDVIAICDSSADYHAESLRLFADLLPDSYWVTLYNKKCRNMGQAPLARTGPPLPAFVMLPNTGYLASTRKIHDDTVKILVMGNKAGAGHTHEDKGGFVLEYAGDTFALDLGICDYEDPIHLVYKHCQRHNMLVPVGTPERAHPLNPLPVDVKPAGHGDSRAFQARIDATAGWEGYYKRWVREWDSPAPDSLTIRDDYELAQGSGVEFYWQTTLPVSVHERTVSIQGRRGVVQINVPPECSVRVDELPLFGGGTHRRIAIRKDAPQGRLEVSVKMLGL